MLLQDKSRLTVLLASNATGTHKLWPLVIGHSKKPRCFNGLNLSRLPVIYKSNSRAWMRADIWENWLRYLDVGFRIQNRKVLLLIDNAPSHIINMAFLHDNSDDETVDNTNIDLFKLTNITVHYLPPNTTAHIQPMDAGIIKSFKSKYKHLYCKHILKQFENNINIER